MLDEQVRHVRRFNLLLFHSSSSAAVALRLYLRTRQFQARSILLPQCSPLNEINVHTVSVDTIVLIYSCGLPTCASAAAMTDGYVKLLACQGGGLPPVLCAPQKNGRPDLHAQPGGGFRHGGVGNGARHSFCFEKCVLFCSIPVYRIISYSSS